MRLRCAKNDPNKAGRRASQLATFGDFGRFAVYAIHTRGDRVQWVLQDADLPNEEGRATIIRRADSLDELGIPDGAIRA